MKRKHMLKPSTINNLITYGIVLIAFLVVFFMDQSGMITRQLRGLLVPVGLNIILAISLNLVVGFLGSFPSATRPLWRSARMRAAYSRLRLPIR